MNKAHESFISHPKQSDVYFLSEPNPVKAKVRLFSLKSTYYSLIDSEDYIHPYELSPKTSEDVALSIFEGV
jgi:hypothetical protein